jgi:hypothetical protein
MRVDLGERNDPAAEAGFIPAGGPQTENRRKLESLRRLLYR